MTITTAVGFIFKRELFQAMHNFTQTTGHVFKCALYDPSAVIDGNTSTYGTTNEVVGTGYAAGGFAWTAAQNITPQNTSGTAFLSWSVNPTWTASSITARGAMIYNTNASNRMVLALDFGANKTTVAGTFVIHLPANDATNAILRMT